MSGGWAGSDRKETLPSDWEQRVAKVRARSGGRCEWKVDPANGNYRRCPNAADGGVDHFKGRTYHELDGLRDSCHRHHSKKSSQEGNDAKREIRTRTRRTPERHPGMIIRRNHG